VEVGDGYLHLGELGGSTAGDLLDAEGDELLLELIELLEEVLLRLGPQLCCFNPGLQTHSVLARFPVPTTFRFLSSTRFFGGRTDNVGFGSVPFCRMSICRWVGGAVVCRESLIWRRPSRENSLLLTAQPGFNVGDWFRAQP
jgi:hypothetical protein